MALLTTFTPFVAVQAQTTFQNDICIPSTLYMMEEVQNDVFVEPLIKRWRPYNDVVRFSGTVEYSRQLQRVASINNPVDGNELTLDLVNQDEFATIKSLSARIQTGTPGVGNGTIKVSIIGDSFTHGGFFKEALLAKDYVPGIKMIGLREVSEFSGQFDEGRGGWTLARYFTVSKDRTHSYNGFWQPDGEFKYWGSTAFWELSKAVSRTSKSDWSFGEYYNTHRFDQASKNYDEDGFRIKPQKNDLMYDNKRESYVRFDGKKWEEVAYEDFEWSFDYTKYLSMWDLESPDILAEFLGLNDFRNAGTPGTLDFSWWNQHMEILIDSYHEAVPEGKFVLMIPSSSCGLLDNRHGAFTTLQNANMWEVRRNIIEHFDNRTDENIYIVDAAISIDNVDGTLFLTDSTFTLPYAEYEGDARISVQEGNPHPYPNYPTMGISLAAFIQRFRSEFNNPK